MTTVQPSAAEIEYHLPFRTMAFSTAVWVVTAALFAYFAVAGHGPVVVLAVAGALGLALLAVRNVVRAVGRRPVAVFTGEGLTFAFSRKLTWDEVASVAIVPGTSGAAWKGFIGVELHDPEAYLARIGPQGRRVARNAMARGSSPVRLPGEIFPVPLEEVVAVMRRYRPELVVRA